MSQFEQHYHNVQKRIEAACLQSARALDTVQLLAVSKTHPPSHIEQLYALGQRAFAENYLQEALEKIAQLQALQIEWHFIGHVQRNKTKLLAQKFDWVHGVDRLIIAERLSSQRGSALSALNICLQVNIDGQDSKEGCAPSQVAELVQQISQLPNLHLRGLMVIPAPDHREALSVTQQLFAQVRGYHAHPEFWDTLSMGMSDDLEAAVAAGSTMLRIGTALFGARDYT